MVVPDAARRRPVGARKEEDSGETTPMMYPSSPLARGPFKRGARRPGFSFLELQVAFVLFAIALAGVCPLVVVQSRQLTKIEGRLGHQAPYYVVPSSDAWARKLGAAASVTATDPGPPTPTPVLTLHNGG